MMIGKRLGGRYEVEQRIGGGGMAIVYKAHDNLLNRTVALKILRSQFGHDDDFISRFRREAQAAASLSHPNVVNVYDVGQEEDIQYIVMEYVEGSTLKELITSSGVLKLDQAVDIAVQICDALEHAHHNHIIHRDIKPHNILIGRGGRVKVTDFGIARAVTSATITYTGTVIGSVHYFSPEQARGGISGEKSDIYSLGIVLYEMITGQVPFSGDSPISIALKHLQEHIVPPREMNPDIPQSLENVILRALVKDPLYRYQSAKEMQRDLQTCLHPDRLNEPKLILETDDDEDQTRVIPAITPKMMEQFASQQETKIGTTITGNQKKIRRKWIQSLGWLGSLALFFVLGLYGFNFILSIFYVPEVTTPRVENMQVEEAINLLKQKELKVVQEPRFSDEIPLDKVIKQSPSPGMRVKENSEVILYVSKGQQQTMMPDLVGLPKRHIDVQLEKFSYVKVDIKPSDKYDAGIVMAQDPPAGDMVFPSKVQVVITVSGGKTTTEMPSLVGLMLTEAEAMLEKHGLKPGKINNEPSYFTQGAVFRQHPFQAGSQVSPGTRIEMWVSSGYPADARVVTEPVMVMVEEGTSADILIVVSDARGEKREAVRRTITRAETFDIEVVLSPDHDATITIYKDGSFLEKKQFDYDNY
jgi:serine/threonine protein kinase